MLKDPENPTRQRAQLRVAQCRVQSKGSPTLIAAVKTPDLEVDAERLYALSQAYRTAKKEAEMFTALNTLAQSYPVSKWNEEGLMAAGNYHWVELEREKAAIAYQLVLDSFPNGKHAYNCEWRIAWVAYLDHQPDADDRLTNFLLKYPTSANAVDALYWLGRGPERPGNIAHGPSFYKKAGEPFPGMTYARTAVPNVDARKFSDVPIEAWKVLFPLPYEAALRREAAKNDFDPMFAAGLIRQESTFQSDAVSHKNAIGLMQVLPKTGKLLARQIKVRYVKNKLFDPDYNIELGMGYIASLVRQTGALEYAAAAYNAGEDRIAAWKSERNYEEIPELVESIPFTETREYVQVVLRNTEVYRMIYGSASVATQTATSHAR